MMRGASFPVGGPIFLGKTAWGCQISWGAKFPVTPVLHHGAEGGGMRKSRFCYSYLT